MGSALGRVGARGVTAEDRGDFRDRFPIDSLWRSVAVASGTVGGGVWNHGVQPHQPVTTV